MSNVTAIRILLVDDYAVVRSGLAAFLTAFDDLALVGEAADGEEAVRLCEQLAPDVVLMDIVMPGMDGLTATRLIRQRCPQTQVLMLTSFPEDELIQCALKAGAIGYLLKNVHMKELAAAVRAAHHGRLTLAPEATQSLMHATTHREVPVPGNDLTERERDVLYYLVRGMENNKIAELLLLSHSTVKFHVSNILSKLHATSRTKAVIIALEHKLVSPSPLLDPLNSKGSP